MQGTGTISEIVPEAETCRIAQLNTKRTIDGPGSAAIELRTALRAALAGVNTLIASLRRQKRHEKLVQSTLQSLKDLQKIAG